jgi:tetratricopeptide (TPR) repeat protein
MGRLVPVHNQNGSGQANSFNLKTKTFDQANVKTFCIGLFITFQFCCCVAQSTAQVKKESEISLPKSAAGKPASGADPASQEFAELPALPLTNEILYKILASEIATQRGDWQTPYVTILSLAHETQDPRLAKRAAEIAMGAQQINEALAAIRLWRQLAPNSAEALQYYLSMMVITGNHQEIKKIFSEQLAQVAPADDASRALLMHQAQRALSRMQDKKQAFVTLENLIEPYLSQVDAHIALAQAAQAMNDHERSNKEARLAQSMQPESELAMLNLAFVLPKAEAEKELKTFSESHPDAKEVQLAYARLLIDTKQFDLAKKAFEAILSKQEKNAESPLQTLYTLGAIEMELNHTVQAEAYFKKYLQISLQLDANMPAQDNTAVLINLAQLALQSKNWELADEWLSQVDRADGKNAMWFNVQMRRALLMANAGKHLAARQFLQQVQTSKDSEEIALFQTEAQIMKDAGQNLEALVLLEAALGSFPESSELLFDFAMLAETQKRYDDMEFALKKVILVSPDNALAYNALGYSYADRNIQLNDALNLIEKANQLSPEDPFILDSLGWIHYRLNHLEQAELVLRHSFALRQDADITTHLAEVLWVQDKKIEAMKLFASAKSKGPANEMLMSTLQRLNITVP